MKVTLISPYPDITVFGLRVMSSLLRNNGIQTQLVLLPDMHGDKIKPGMQRYSDSMLDELAAKCSDSDLIGITLMTSYYDNAVQITQKLKETTDAPIIWGGIHAIIEPKQCLQMADMVCVGEGEDVLLELAQRISCKQDYFDIPNIWFKDNGQTIENKIAPLNQDLNSYPVPDYSGQDHYIMYEDHLVPLTKALTERILSKNVNSRRVKHIAYQTMTGRGCPHKCTYCMSDSLRKIYGCSVKEYVRWRSIPHIMEELVWVKENLSFVESIWISDDTFLGRSLQSLEQFCSEYKEKVGLPFMCLGNPQEISEKKMDLLVDAGLEYLQMGVQSGSPRIQEIFGRSLITNDKILNAMKIINKYKNMLLPRYDFIIDTVYETDAETIETIRLVSRIPKPFKLQIFSLILYPGTKLYSMANEDGYISDEKSQVYYKMWSMRQLHYLNLLIIMAKQGRFPGFLLRFMVTRPAVILFKNKFSETIFREMYLGLKLIFRKLRNIGEVA